MPCLGNGFVHFPNSLICVKQQSELMTWNIPRSRLDALDRESCFFNTGFAHSAHAIDLKGGLWISFFWANKANGASARSKTIVFFIFFNLILNVSRRKSSDQIQRHRLNWHQISAKGVIHTNYRIALLHF